MTEIVDDDNETLQDRAAKARAFALSREPHPLYPNLRPFRKGETGDQSGKKQPGYKPFRAIAQEILGTKIMGHDPIKKEKREMTLQERLMLQWVAEGINGNLIAMKTLKDVADEVDNMATAKLNGNETEYSERKKIFDQKIAQLKRLSIDPFKIRKKSKI